VPLWVWNGTACAQAIDIGRAEPQLLEHLVVVFAEFRSALCGHQGDAMQSNRAADRRGQLAPGTFLPGYAGLSLFDKI
jgi:hypothetical protein